MNKLYKSFTINEFSFSQGHLKQQVTIIAAEILETIEGLIHETVSEQMPSFGVN